MKHALVHFSTSRPRTVYAIVLFMALGLGALSVRINIDTDPENMLSGQQEDRVFHNLVEQRFTLSDAIVVGLVNEDHPDGIYNTKSLTALHALSKAILDMEGVMAPDLMSLSESDNIDQEGPGTIRFEWMMKDAPVTEEQSLAIRDKVGRLPLLQDTLVAGDGKAAAIYVPIASKDLSRALSLEIRAVADTLDSGDSYHITGLPVAEDTFGHDMFLQMGISAPMAGVMIFLLMLYFFRSPLLVVSPMLVAMATVIVTMGLMIGMGFTVHIMSSMIPIFLMPIAVVDSVHIMSDFAEAWRPGKDRKEVITKVVDHLFTPMLFTSLTSAVGFLSLVLTPIPPVQVFGAFVAFGIMFAFLLTITLIPAYIVRMNPDRLSRLAASQTTTKIDTPLARALRSIGKFTFNRGKLVTGVAVALLAISIAGIFRIEINDNPVRWFKANHPIRVADEVLNQHFAGTYDAFLVLTHEAPDAVADFIAEADRLLASAGGAPDALSTTLPTAVREALHANPGAIPGASDQYFGNVIAAVDDALFEVEAEDGYEALAEALTQIQELAETVQSSGRYFQRPDVLAYIEKVQAALLASGEVGKTNALPDVVKVVNRELQGGDESLYRIPASVPGVAQTLLQFQSSHRPQDLWHMVTPDFSSTAIWVQLKSGDNQDMSRVIKALDLWLADNPAPEQVEMRWAGKTFINVVWQDAMVSGMVWSLVGAFGTVFLMMIVLFRSLRLGLLAMIPLSVTILGVYGAIGWIGKDYDMPIAVLSSLTLGLSVDFAIYFIQRMRSLLHESGSFATATVKIFEEPARAIARNAIVIAIGFAPLFFAPLVPYITVGAFMAAIMAVSGIATLVLLPALMGIAGSWLFPNMHGRGAFTNDALASTDAA